LAPAVLGLLNLACVGIAGAASARLAWPMWFGIPLFIQVCFFMFLCYSLARRTRLDPGHPNFANTAAATVIAQMERTRIRLLAVDLIGGGSAVVLGIIFLIVASPNTPRASPLLLAVASVLLALGLGLLFHSITLFPRRSEYEYARHSGAPATARVLKVTNLRVRRPGPAYDAARLYLLELEVQPPMQAPYHATIQQLIRQHPSNMPQVGALIAVKYLPEQPQVVVALVDPEDKLPDAS
jgi:hypothetical protein